MKLWCRRSGEGGRERETHTHTDREREEITWLSPLRTAHVLKKSLPTDKKQTNSILSSCTVFFYGEERCRKKEEGFDKERARGGENNQFFFFFIYEICVVIQFPRYYERHSLETFSISYRIAPTVFLLLLLLLLLFKNKIQG